jgi:23S rRNA (uracil1939-C5)-methyltransferase
MLRILRIGAGGDGVAQGPDGAPYYVPGTLPGETVRADLAVRSRATLREVVASSPDRVAPPCPYFGTCGGCALQHWAAAPYAAWKRAKLVAALTRAGFAEPPVAETVQVPPGTRRRADLALRRGADGAVTIGLHATGSGDVVDLRACVVLDPRLVALFDPLRALLRRLGALRREGSSVLTLLDTGPDLLLRTDGPLDAAGRAALAGFARDHGLPRIAWAAGDGAPELAAQLGPATIRIGAVSVAPPPGAFLQPSPEGEAVVRDAVLAGLPARMPPRMEVAELYAGIGTLTFALAERGLRVAAFEGSAAAVEALAGAAGRAGLGGITAIRRDLARQPLLVRELGRFAAVVLDPPFAGAEAQMALLARAGVPRILHVSCNPAALAREAALLARAGYRLLSAVPIDQFLWSPHLEAVTVFQQGG